MTRFFSVHTERYDIPCKYMGTGSAVKYIILGVHGFNGDKESSALCALAEKMEKRGGAVVCFDFPAHGESRAQDDALTVENCMADVTELASWCRREYPEADKTVFATSYGGYIALLCSRELCDFRFILRAPAVTMPEHILTDILGLSADEYKEQGCAVCGFERKICLPYSFYEELRRNRVTDKHFDFPALVIHGDADDIVPPEDIRKFCAENEKFTLSVVKGADHRFKKPGELEQVISLAEKAIIGE